MNRLEVSRADVAVDVYRRLRTELARADLSEHDQVLYSDGLEVLEAVLRAEGVDPDAVTTAPA